MSALSGNLVAHHAARPRGRGPVARIDAAFRLWNERQNLARLEPRMLRDVGLQPEDVVRERSRSIWDAPSWWT